MVQVSLTFFIPYIYDSWIVLDQVLVSYAKHLRAEYSLDTFHVRFIHPLKVWVSNFIDMS